MEKLHQRRNSSRISCVGGSKFYEYFHEAKRFIPFLPKVGAYGGQPESGDIFGVLASLEQTAGGRFIRQAKVLKQLAVLLDERGLLHSVSLVDNLTDSNERMFARYILRTLEEDPREVLRIQSAGSVVIIEAREGNVWTSVLDHTGFNRQVVNGKEKKGESQYAPQIAYALDLAFPKPRQNPAPNGETLA